MYTENFQHSFDEQWLKKVFFSSNKLHYLINVTADQEINIATGLSLAHAVTEVKIELKIYLITFTDFI
ncbi:hypothetical protein T09_5752 [Trichinella sp. T9]|nr:hypothetical protein T09_5752 [Trichinella sp. T9]